MRHPSPAVNVAERTAVKGVLLELRLLAKTVPEYSEPAPLLASVALNVWVVP